MRRSIRYILTTVLCLVFFHVTKAQHTDTFPIVEEVPPEYMQDSVYVTSNSSYQDSYQFKEAKASRVDVKKVPEQDLNKIRADEDYWYANETPPRQKRKISPPGENHKGEKEKEDNGSFLNSTLFNTLFWVILISGFLALLIWFLATSNIRLFKKVSKPAEEVEELPTEDIFEMNFEKEIQKAIDAKNYRLAVRLMYLRTLRDLSNKTLITYTHEKTNSDYLFQLAGTSFYKNFFRLTRSFDYTWYGQFELSPDSFAIVQNDFDSFKQQLS